MSKASLEELEQDSPATGGNSQFKRRSRTPRTFIVSSGDKIKPNCPESENFLERDLVITFSRNGVFYH